MLKSILSDYANTLNKTFAHDRSTTIGASEIGQCARKVYWLKKEGTPYGVSRDDDYEDRWGARIRGTIMEDKFWEPALRLRYGDNLLFAGKQQVTIVSKDAPLSATPDALVINQPRDALAHLGIPDIGEGQCFLAEAKTIDPRTNLIEAKHANYMQTMAQLGLIRELTPYKPEYDLLTYTDASFWDEVHEFVVPFEQHIFDTMKSRAIIIINAGHAAELKPEGWIAGGKECSFCPFVKACNVERRSVPKDNARASPQFVAEISDYAIAANELEAQIDRQSAILNDMKDEIKTRLREKGVRRIEGVVNWYTVAGRTSYSSKAMKESLIHIGSLHEKISNDEVVMEILRENAIIAEDVQDLSDVYVTDVEQFTSIGEPSDRLVLSATKPTDSAGPAILLPGTIVKKRKPNVIKKEAGKRKAAKPKQRTKKRTAAKRKRSK